MANTFEPKISQTTWKGESAVLFSAGGYEALMIPGVGANIIELKDLKRNLNLLRTPDDLTEFKTSPQVYGIPLLFPPNRIGDGTFTAAGQTYHFPINAGHNNHIHGFLHTRPWKITKMDVISDDAVEVEAVFVNNESSDFYTYFPHNFECKLLYHLSSSGLKQKTTMTNQSNALMPMGLGFHTAIRIPFDPKSKGEDYRVKASFGERWELSERILPTGKRLPLSEKEKNFRGEGNCPFGEKMDCHYTALPLQIDGHDFHGAIIKDTSTGIKLVYEVGPGYKHWMIWNRNGNDGFVCPEPQTWIINAPNVDLPDEETGMKILEPQASWEETCKFYIVQ